MKAPLSWLREFVRIDRSVEEIASTLAMTGTEVERVTSVGVPGGGEIISRFVVGKVLTCAQHPNADKLSVCSVDVREDLPRTIVCGAPNVAAGQTVAVSLPGAILPNGLRLKETRIRGVVSSGMILSEAELGFAARSEGIVVLPPNWMAGDLLADHLPLAEHILEVEVTPNRPDCLSIRGLAREIAAVTGEYFEEDVSYYFPVDSRPVEEDIAVEVWDQELCPRYAARVIRDVQVRDSPTWLKARIVHAGMRPINNVVDTTNYVMWALGQPLHAFDLATIRGRRIIVRRAQPRERIVTLDGVERELSERNLVIADAEQPSVIAGIMGSLDSEVSDETTDLLLEAANFNGPNILQTSSTLGLRSESSTRFEKGLDPNLIPLALDMASSLLVEICGGSVSTGTVDVKTGEFRPWDVGLRACRVEAVLGKIVPVSEIRSILGSLGCEVKEAKEELVVTVPTFRRDLEREIDLVEEVARIHGLDQLPSTLPGRKEGRGGLTKEQRLRREVQDLLRGAGLSEVVTYAFIDPGWPDRLRLEHWDPRRKAVVLANPLSSEQSVMRTMLLPGLLSTAARNLAVREDRVHVFEMARTFHPRDEGLPETTLPHEVLRVGLLLLGDWFGESWTAPTVAANFYLAKGIVERLLRGLCLTAEYTRAEERFLHPGKSARLLVGKQPLGWLGELHPLVLQAFDLPAGVVAAEIDLDALLGSARGLGLFEDFLTFPAVEQDLALLVERSLPAARVVRAVYEAEGGHLLRDVRLFDVYEGSPIPVGKKSLALRLTFRARDRTLSENEVNERRGEMLASLRESIGAELRT